MNNEGLKEKSEFELLVKKAFNESIWADTVIKYFKEELNVSDDIAARVFKDLMKYDDILIEFTTYLIERTYDIEDAIIINGYTAKKIAELNPNWNASGVYSFLRLLRDDYEKASQLIKNSYLNEEENIEEEEKEKKEEPEEEIEEEKVSQEKKKDKNKDSKKDAKKKKIIIFSIIGGVILVIAIATVVFFLLKPSSKKETPKVAKTWSDVLKNQAEDGTLIKTINDELDDLNIRTNEAEAMVLDIDSDDDMEFLVYTEDEITDKNKLIVFEVDKDVKYSKDYTLNSDESLAYAYNIINENMYYYVINNTNYTTISLQDKEYDEADFNTNFYVITNQYQNEEILSNAEEINLKKENIKSIIEKILKKQFTNEDLLDDNNTSKSKIEKALKEKEEEEKQKILEEQQKQEEEQKKKEEEEKQKQEELKKQQEEQKKANSLTVGDYSLEYKVYAYNTNDANESITLQLNKGGVCYYAQGMGEKDECKYEVVGDLENGKWGIKVTFEDKTTQRFEVVGNNTLSDGWHKLS